MNFQQARSNMIEQQVRPWDVLDQRVLDVLAEVPRDAFVAPEHRQLAYSDYELPIGHGQHMFKPVVEGRLLQSLQLATTDSVLEIGAGSGYLTACIGRLAQRVEALEIVPELAELATARLTEHGVANAHVRVQDAETTWDARDAYEAILIGGSVPVVPEYYKNKLAIDGRLIAVVGTTAKPTMEAIRLVRVTETEWLTESLFETCLPPLSSGAPEAPRFVF
jgi:protein-L-isoaspartate(D-aspartate) O-methyltransferase